MGETIVDEAVSQYGLYRVHVLADIPHGDVEVLTAWRQDLRIRWIERKVTGVLMAVVQYDEEELGVHHLRMYWKDTDGQ